MKILHVLPPLTKGGAEKIAVELANYFAAAGNHVAILASWPVDPSLLQYTISAAVDIRFVSNKAANKGVYVSAVRWMIANRSWVAEHDIVHCHLSFGSAFGSLVVVDRKIRRATLPKVVETYHAVGMPMPQLARRLHMCSAAMHDGFVSMANDPAIADFVRMHPQLPYAMIPNGITLPYPAATMEQSREYRALLGIPQAAAVVGTVGRLVAGRRPEQFIKIFGEIAKQRPDVHFVMAGEGPEEAVLRRLADNAGFGGRMHLPGLAKSPALPYSIIDLYVTLNVGPITGIAALEAASTGIPLIAYQANACHREGVDDWMFSSADPINVAVHAVRLLSNNDERRALAARQRAHVITHHSVEAMAAAYRSFYQRVLAEP